MTNLVKLSDDELSLLETSLIVASSAMTDEIEKGKSYGIIPPEDGVKLIKEFMKLQEKLSNIF